jgi:hypothetical protein
MYSFFDTTDNSKEKSKIGYGTNNQYLPPRMEDGRSLNSSYETIVNDNLLKKNGIKSNWEYRQYLTHNAKEVMQYNFIEACNETGCVFQPSPQNNNTNSPFLFKSYDDNTKPYGYQDSDLKQIYLTREQLNSKKVVPVLQI